MIKKNTPFFYLPLLLILCFAGVSCHQNKATEEAENDAYDNPGLAAEFQFNRTKNPVTGKVDRSLMWEAVMQTKAIKNNMAAKANLANSANSTTALTWTERGSYTDAPGIYANSRPGNGVTSGRVRAVWPDLADATGKTVWVGGVDGGLWKTTDITASTVNWILVNDYLSNLAVSSICQDPTNTNIMYFCTGESFFNADAVNGNGVFKSTDHGVTWTLLPSTSNLVRCSKILCDASGNVYVSTIGISIAVGLQRSSDGGNTWTSINPFTTTSRVTDFVISSTGAMHVVGGLFSAAGVGGYKYIANPATATTSNWTSPTQPFNIPYTTNGGGTRAALACNGNTVYAALAHSNSSGSTSNIDSIAKSTDGGKTWNTVGLTAGNITSLNGSGGGQAWFSMTIGVDPSNANNVMVGSLDVLSSTDGGNTFSTISQWVGSSGQYVHADQHIITWYNNGAKLLVGCDGGIFYSTDKGNTFIDRNTNLRLKQFYSVAIHPTLTNYFLGGTQDNGVHQLNGPGLTSSIEVTGGDGGFVAIDQNQPQYQFGAYVYNQYRVSRDGGTSWSAVNLSNSAGLFINPYDYDNTNKIMYCSYSAGQFLRWDNPQTGNSNTPISISNFNSGTVSAVSVSPYTTNRVYFGTSNATVVQVDNANAATPTATTITPSGMSGYVNSIVAGTSDKNLIASVSSYGVNNVWLTTNGGTSWTQCDGNLPDMPVYWALFNPDDNTKAYIATEAGVWSTTQLNGSATVWVPEASFPTVRTDMLKYRSTDRLIAAATHGRGIWTANLTAACTTAAISGQPSNASVCAGSNTTFSIAGTGSSYQWQVSTDGGTTFSNIANSGLYSGVTSTALSITGATAAINNYKYRCVVSGICNTSTTTANSNAATLTINTTPTVNVTASATSVCSGTNVTLTASGANSYSWTPAATGNIITVTPAITSTYTVTGSNTNGCSSSASIVINATAKPVASLNAAPYTSLFPGQTTTLTASGTSSTASAFKYNWSYSGAGLTPAFSGNSVVANVYNAGIYTVTVADSANTACVSLPVTITISDSASSRLFIYPNPNNGQFSVSFYNGSSSVTKEIVTIYNSLGQQVFTNSYPLTYNPYQIITINAKNLSAGIYYIDLRDGNGGRIKTGKLEIK